MKVQSLDIPGLLLADMEQYPDQRGFFVERYHERRFKEAGIPAHFVQDNFSRSRPGVLRGLHLQGAPSAQGKLVTVLRGRIFDVAVDLRPNSNTFKKWIGIELSGDAPQWFWIPPGFAHGFCVLGNEPADVLYKVDCYYDPKTERGIHWADPEIGIQWPLAAPVLSEKDQKLPRLKDAHV